VVISPACHHVIQLRVYAHRKRWLLNWLLPLVLVVGFTILCTTMTMNQRSVLVTTESHRKVLLPMEETCSLFGILLEH
jgi:hypothetical protein